MGDATNAASALVDKAYGLIGMCSCTYPLCQRCDTIADLIREIVRLGGDS